SRVSEADSELTGPSPHSKNLQMIIRGRLLLVGSLIAALVALAHCNTDEKKDGRAGKPLNPNGPSFMRKRQWNGEIVDRAEAEISEQPEQEQQPLRLRDPALTLKSALDHLRWRRLQEHSANNRAMRLVWVR
ncbi:hypothetical protein PFISCL1PPCAC_12420, partial [Pristionchus fissidentatus]